VKLHFKGEPNNMAKLDLTPDEKILLLILDEAGREGISAEGWVANARGSFELDTDVPTVKRFAARLKLADMLEVRGVEGRYYITDRGHREARR